MEKKKTDRKSPFADTSFRDLEQNLANAMPGGAVQYHRQRWTNRLSLWLSILALAAIPCLILAAAYAPDGYEVSKETLVAVPFGILTTFGFSAWFFYTSGDYRKVRGDVRTVRQALARAEKVGIEAASGSWGYTLGDLLSVTHKSAEEAAKSRGIVEKSIEASDQRKAARLKKTLQGLMRAGRIVEAARRYEHCKGTLGRWDGPVVWPGERSRRAYVAGSVTGVTSIG